MIIIQNKTYRIVKILTAFNNVSENLKYFNLQGSENENGDNRAKSPEKGSDSANGRDDIHHAQPVDVNGDGVVGVGGGAKEEQQPVTLESYGVCAVSLYDYQVSLINLSLFYLILLLNIKLVVT